MALPLYKILEIYDAKKAAVWAKMANAPIGALPVIFDITKLAAKERQALEFIEEFVRLKKAATFPYPLYVISTIKNHQGVIELFESINHVPQFFRKKNRPLNMKENSLLSKVNLKQSKLANVNPEDFDNVSKNYSSGHKVIFKKQSYLDYMATILKELRGKE